jgi:hypothetical protein
MAINFMVGIAIAHPVPAQSGESGEDLAQDLVNPGATKVQVSARNSASGAEESLRRPGVQDESNAAPSPTKVKGTRRDDTAQKQKNKEKRGAIVAAPLPISSPAIGTGIIPFVGYIFPLDREDKVTPPSMVGGAGLITNNGSRALALGGQLYLKRGAYQITSLYLSGHLNYGFYGTGSVAGNAGRKLAVVQTGHIFSGEGLRRIGWKFYLGPRAWVAHSEITRDLSKSDVNHPDIPSLYLKTDVKAFGVRLLRDSRPNHFYPTRGTLFDFTSEFFYVSPSAELGGSATGSTNSLSRNRFTFQAYRLTFNKYASLSKRQVLAYNLYFCGVNGQAPFYGQCIFGTDNELRGYVAGRYIDRRMFATQVEYRLELPKRFGFAAFGGVGEVAPTAAKFRYDDLLPGIGTGLRYILSKQYHVNLRLDIAQGKNGHTWSMGVAEAF